MAKVKQIKTYKQSTVNAIILVLVLAFCVYLAIQLSTGASPQVSTQRTQTVTDSSYAYLEGYVFRLEDRVTAPEGAVVDYLVRDGEKVGVGHEYLSIYSSAGLDSEQRKKTEADLLNLSDRIHLIESGLSQSNKGTDLSSIGKELSSEFYSYVNSVIGGDLGAANKTGDKLLSSMVEYSVSTGGDTAKSVINELKAQRNGLLSSLGTRNAVTSDEGFNFMYSSDGYEAIFSSDKLEGLTPDGLLALADARPEQTGERIVGRRIYSPKWYVAIPANESTYLGFVEGAVYDVTFTDSNGATIDMTLERICIDEEDPSNAYMLFSSYDLAVAASFSRTQSVRIYLGKCSGYRVPKQAIHEGKEYDYVYILVGNVVELRRVTVKGEGNGYYIVDTYEEDLDDNVSSEIPYLKINDLLITSGNDLYDGKHLD